ncbi:copper resistance CopC family protein [Cognatishimia sp. F0-27]|uniref:copper resistance CopC family protein n=1 Tax=Cognatishimia sp. F0-27 TaxID=2816855 RepID=UPI001D0CDB8C|nr:copper resistance CopC family protein [Cognatishimia sp. F0-27]MCC1492815.1 copper resistance protein CopC [Cognatishimia sp. F0-27]
MKSRLALTLAAALLGGVAYAHSEKEGTTPIDGAQLTETPEMIHMVFDDPMRVTTIRLVNADGVEMPMERGTGLEPSLEFHAEPEPLRPGSYTVEWRGLASDGHAMQGRFSFELTE